MMAQRHQQHLHLDDEIGFVVLDEEIGFEVFVVACLNDSQLFWWCLRWRSRRKLQRSLMEQTQITVIVDR
jgi:hypothetical protein